MKVKKVFPYCFQCKDKCTLHQNIHLKVKTISFIFVILDVEDALASLIHPSYRVYLCSKGFIRLPPFHTFKFIGYGMFIPQ